MSPAAARQRKLAYLAWAAVCVIWGTTYFGIRISLETMPPFLMGGLRWMLAGVLLTLWLVIRREALPPPSRWGWCSRSAFSTPSRATSSRWAEW